MAYQLVVFILYYTTGDTSKDLKNQYLHLCLSVKGSFPLVRKWTIPYIMVPYKPKNVDAAGRKFRTECNSLNTQLFFKRSSQSSTKTPEMLTMTWYKETMFSLCKDVFRDVLRKILPSLLTFVYKHFLFITEIQRVTN